MAKWRRTRLDPGADELKDWDDGDDLQTGRPEMDERDGSAEERSTPQPRSDR
jgi:hypothetical protein